MLIVINLIKKFKTQKLIITFIFKIPNQTPGGTEKMHKLIL